jgi:hypothetical protein
MRQAQAQAEQRLNLGAWHATPQLRPQYLVAACHEAAKKSITASGTAKNAQTFLATAMSGALIKIL